MAPSFHPFEPAACVLCGSHIDPSGEHKIKASSLRDQFGVQPMVIVRDGEPPRSARGPKSRQFHFSVPLCSPCNNERTRDADLEWDRFRRAALDRIASGQEPVTAFDAERYAPVGSANPKHYLDVLRYLAKLVSGHLAEIAAPRSERLSRFALGLSDDCPISVAIVRDPTYAEHARAWGDHPYAAHGGLVLLSDTQRGETTGFHTALSLGPLQCAITYRLDSLERRELTLEHSAFAAWCRERASDAAETPVSSDKLIKLGLEPVTPERELPSSS